MFFNRINETDYLIMKKNNFLNSVIYAYLILLFGGLPLYMQDKLVMIGNAKYNFFRNTTMAIGAVVLLGVLYTGIRERKRLSGFRALRDMNRLDIFMLLYLGTVVLSYLTSPYKENGFWGYPGWYMGLVTQLLLVGIYFACSRFYDGSKSIWIIAGTVAGIVTLIGLLNRLDMDVLGVFRGMENGAWNRTHLLSTIGNNNWYAGYISVTAGITMAAALCGKKYSRIAGMLGSLLFYASALTADCITSIAAAVGLSLLILLLSLKERSKLLRALELTMLLPVADFAVYLWMQSGIPGLVLEGESEKRLFFSPVWLVLFAVQLICYLVLYRREKLARQDLLQDGRIFHIVWIAVAVAAAVGLLALGIFLVMGEMILRQQETGWLSEVLKMANGRPALWCVTVQTYFQENIFYKIVGMGPDSYYDVLYQWGTGAMKWINEGLLENSIYTNAHNEWLTMLIEQGILGVITYGGIFVTGLGALWKKLWQRPEYLAVFLGIAGYLICSLFTFQHVLSTPFAFALLGMARGVLFSVP